MEHINIDLVKLSSLPAPLIATMCGGDEWEIFTVNPISCDMLVYVCGLLEEMRFSSIMSIKDGDNQTHDPDNFYF